MPLKKRHSEYAFGAGDRATDGRRIYPQSLSCIANATPLNDAIDVFQLSLVQLHHNLYR